MTNMDQNNKQSSQPSSNTKTLGRVWYQAAVGAAIVAGAFSLVVSVVMVRLLPPCWWLYHLRGLYHEMAQIVQRSDGDSFPRIPVWSGFGEFAS